MSSEGRLRIVQVVTSMLVGGMEQFVLRLAAAQRDQGHEVSILTLRNGPLLAEAEQLGLPVVSLDGKGRISRAVHALRSFHQTRPHVVHAHNPGALSYALFGRTCGARVLMTRHGQLAAWNPTPLQVRFTDAVVAVSGAAADTLRERQPQFNNRVTTILNGVQTAAPARAREAVRTELGVHGLVGIIVARLDRLKGHEILLHSLAQLRDRAVPLTMLIAGDGEQRTALEQLSLELRLACDHVRFLGYRADVTDLLAASDLFVLPSRSEGLPLSVLEAMSHGLPVIATPVGGVPEALNGDECGISVPVGDVDGLTAALEQLAASTELRHRLGAAGLSRVQEHFSFESMTRKYEELYGALLTGSNTARDVVEVPALEAGTAS